MVLHWDAVGGPDELAAGSYRMRVLSWKQAPAPLGYVLSFGSTADSVQHVEVCEIGTAADPEAVYRQTWATSYGAKQLKSLFLAMAFELGEPAALLARAVAEQVVVRLEREPGGRGLQTRFRAVDAPAPPGDRYETLLEQARQRVSATPSILPGPPAILPAPSPTLPPRESTMIPIREPQHLGQLGSVTARRVAPPPVICPRCQLTMPRDDWAAHIERHDQQDEALEVED